MFSKLNISSLEKLLESTCRKKNTPFLLSAKYNKLESLKLFTEWNCNIYARNGKLQNAMHIATSRGYGKILDFLVKIDADKNILRSQQDIQQRIPKHLDISNKLDMYFFHI